jgi:hypothetical protein
MTGNKNLFAYHLSHEGGKPGEMNSKMDTRPCLPRTTGAGSTTAGMTDPDDSPPPTAGMTKMRKPSALARLFGQYFSFSRQPIFQVLAMVTAPAMMQLIGPFRGGPAHRRSLKGHPPPVPLWPPLWFWSFSVELDFWCLSFSRSPYLVVWSETDATVLSDHEPMRSVSS